MKTQFFAYPYYRVSTLRQGRSGLGLAAQRQAVEDFARRNGYRLGKAYVEIESGRKNKRPVLAKALQTCRANKAVLLIAKLDRLSRNVQFISSLMESGIEFKAVDNPNATKLVLHILAAFAEHERDEIGRRTREALQAAKQRGRLLGEHGRTVLADRNREAAKRFALRMKPILYRLQREGITTLRALAAELNRRHVPTFQRGAKWHPNTVHNILKKLKGSHPETVK